MIEIIGFQPGPSRRIPLFTMSVSAGVPIPVEDDVDKHIDLNEYLVEHPAATFFAKVTGDSMKDAGIRDGDILIVDTSVDASDGRLVIASINGELSIRYYREIDGQVYLESQNSHFLPINIGDYMRQQVIGVVTKIIHSF